MPVNPIESGQGGLWRGKQSALGTIAPSAGATVQRLRKTGDNSLKVGKKNGRASFADGLRFASSQTFADTVNGDVGNVTYLAQLETAGCAFAQMFGVDVVTGTTPDYTHTIVSGTTASPYQTWFQKVGQSIGPWAVAFWDAKTSDLEWKASAGDKVAQITEQVMCLKAQTFNTDPTSVDSGTDASLWTENCGSPNKVTIAGTVFEEVQGETLKITSPYSAEQGQCLEPIALLPGRSEMGPMRNFQTFMTDNVIAEMKQAVFNSATPTAGTRVTSNVRMVAMESEYFRSSVRTIKITTPNVQIDPDDFGDGTRDAGGKIDVILGGQAIQVGGTPAVTIVVKNGDATSYVA